MQKTPALTLYSRLYCHLCDDMQAALQPLLTEFHATLFVVDVDADPVLEARFDILVPVLMLGRPQDLHAESEEICHYHADLEKTRCVLQHYANQTEKP